MNRYLLTYNQLIKENNGTFPITEQYIFNELKIKCIANGEQVSDEILHESASLAYEIYKEGWGWDILKTFVPHTASDWAHFAAYIGGAIDPTGLIDLAHAGQLIYTGHPIIGGLTLLGAIPYIGDTGKLLIPAVKNGTKIGPKLLPIATKFVSLGNKFVAPLEKIISKFLTNPKFAAWAAKKFGTSATALDISKGIINGVMKAINNLIDPKLVKWGGQGAKVTRTSNKVLGSLAEPMFWSAGLNDPVEPWMTPEEQPIEDETPDLGPRIRPRQTRKAPEGFL